MEILVSQLDAVYIVKLSGRWDAFSAADFEQACADMVEAGMRHMVIDVANVGYISSFGLRSLLNLGRLLDPLQGVVHVSCLQPQVRKVFVGSGFSSLYPEYPDVESALSAFGPGTGKKR